MTILIGKHPGGTPKGTIRKNSTTSGAYSNDPGYTLLVWRRKNPGTAAHADELIASHLRFLKWDAAHPRFNEVRDLAVLTISRGMLFMKILEMDYTRKVKNPVTGVTIKERAADQLRRLEELDINIQDRIVNLGLLSNHK